MEDKINESEIHIKKLRDELGNSISPAQYNTLEKNKYRMGGYRGIRMDYLLGCLMVSFKESEMICGIEKDGHLHS